jgi:DNA-binding winged helix-turn-helix (wHTH) protein
MLDQRPDATGLRTDISSDPASPPSARHRTPAWRDTLTSLSPSEMRILNALLEAPARVVGRDELARAAATDARRGLDAHMYRLRHKLHSLPGLTLETVPKRGFRLVVCPAGS